MVKLNREAAIKCVSFTHLCGNEVIQLLSGKQKELWCTAHVCARVMNIWPFQGCEINTGGSCSLTQSETACYPLHAFAFLCS